MEVETPDQSSILLATARNSGNILLTYRKIFPSKIAFQYVKNKKTFQYVKRMLPLFRAVVKLCTTNRLFIYFLFNACLSSVILYASYASYLLYYIFFAPRYTSSPLYKYFSKKYRPYMVFVYKFCHFLRLTVLSNTLTFLLS